jgi:nicotinamide N-methyltransferase
MPFYLPIACEAALILSLITLSSLTSLFRWDELSHASLIKSVTSLLRKERQSRVFMVSGIHTGRSKIISFLRRAHRQGLRLVPFPLESKFDWPALIPSEIKVQERQSELYASDDALAQASQHIIEMQVLSHEMEESPLISSLNDGTRIWSAKTARLSNNRRAFVVEDRDEEKDNTDGSVHFRNRWITFLALAWQE